MGGFWDLSPWVNPPYTPHCPCVLVPTYCTTYIPYYRVPCLLFALGAREGVEGKEEE